MSVKITSEEMLADTIRDATEPFAIRGGGTRGIKGDGTPLDLSGLSGITLYEPGALTLVAQAGTTMSEINKTLAQENQRLAFEPMDQRGLMGTTGSPTIGGAMSANVSGPRRIAVGAARDFALGVRFVDGTGTIVKNGGRVMKNVTGYDLVKLMCGAYGTLGVLTEIALKVLPTPETEATLLLRGLNDADAIRAMADALGSPFEVSGAAHDPAQGTALRVEGFAASTRYRIGALRDLLAGYGAEMDELTKENSSDNWRAIRDVTPFHDETGDVWRVSCKPSDGPTLAAAAGAEQHLFDWAGGLIWCRMTPGTDLRARLGTFDGHATLLRADAQTRKGLGVFHPQPAGVARLSAGLRARFDPQQRLNPGLMDPAP